MRCRKTWSMEEKVRFVLAWERGELTMAELCRQERVSRRSGYVWLERYAAGGLVGLQPRSRAPLHHPHAVSEAIAAAGRAARAAHPTWGPKKLRVWLQAKRPGEPWPAASTMGALLSRHGLSVPRRRRHRVPPRTQPFAACVGANDGWAADFKGWFRTGDGSRCEPFTLSDSASRYLLRCQAVPAIAADQVWPVLEAAFREYGLPRVLRTDNGPPFASCGAGGLSRLAVRLIKAGVVPERIAPGQPQQNGRHERLHQTLQRDTANPPARTLAEQQRRFAVFRRVYNEERPHEALGQQTPASQYAPSPRAYSGRLREPDYASEQVVRRVRANGEIRWQGELIFVSEALMGEPVGIAEGEDGWRVHFGPVELGWLEQHGAWRLRRPGPRRCAQPGASRRGPPQADVQA
jgi:putative transposase